MNEIARRHEVLRTRFVSAEGKAVQIVEPEVRVTAPVIDLRALARPRPREAVLEKIGADGNRADDSISPKRRSCGYDSSASSAKSTLCS